MVEKQPDSKKPKNPEAPSQADLTKEDGSQPPAEISLFKGHPLTPDAIRHTVNFLRSNRRGPNNSGWGQHSLSRPNPDHKPSEKSEEKQT